MERQAAEKRKAEETFSDLPEIKEARKEKAADRDALLRDKLARQQQFGADGGTFGSSGGRPEVPKEIKRSTENLHNKSNLVQPGMLRVNNQPPSAHDALKMIEWMKEVQK